jgi:hypothetical protein
MSSRATPAPNTAARAGRAGAGIFRRRSPHDIPDKQIHRWLDDGGAVEGDQEVDRRTPVAWSPPALNARLDAERALHALSRRRREISVDARRAIHRIVDRVERRQLTLRAATDQLRSLTARLHQHRRLDEATGGPSAWELLGRRPAPGLRGVSAKWNAFG